MSISSRQNHFSLREMIDESFPLMWGETSNVLLSVSAISTFYLNGSDKDIRYIYIGEYFCAYSEFKGKGSSIISRNEK